MTPSSLPPESHRLADDRLPTPFSAEQIRDSSPPGTRVAFRIEEAGKDPIVERWEFIATGALEGTRRRWTELLDGTPLEQPEEMTSTWLSLQAHASYPVASTTVTAETVETPMGTFDGWVYTVQGEDGSVTRAWFARDLPGPPALLEVERDGSVVHRMMLIERS